MWSYIIDGLIVVILVVSIAVGIVKGLFDSILGLISTALALAVSVFASKYISGFINNIFGLEPWLEGKIGSGEGLTLFGQTLSSNEIAKFCVWLITTVVVFLIVKLVIFILAKLFEKVSQNSPTISGLNRVLGLVFGLVKGAMVCFALLAVCSIISEVPVLGTTIKTGIADTKIANAVYKYVDEFVENQLTAEKVNDIISRIASK
ncbi:MAG: CvpA family protein [Clostridiales bacterium]|nr:CvpA family protein [Clostridiales bacterium]